MSIISKPSVTFNIVSSPGEIANAPQRVLLIGQKASSGTAPVNEIVQSLPSNGVEDTLFGRRSMLSTMVRIFKKYNAISRLDVLPLADPVTAPTAATATITITGTPTGAGNIIIAVQSERYHKISVPVTTASTANTIAAAIAAAISANDTILVTAEDVSNVVTLTASHTGLDGDQLKMRVVQGIDGVTIALSAFSGGAGNVPLPDLDDIIGSFRYQTIVTSTAYEISDIQEYLDAAFNATNAVRDGVLLVHGTQPSAAGAIGAVASLDSKCVVYLSDESVSSFADQKGGAIVEYNPALATYFAAIRALRLTPGANIAPYLVGANISNTFGGAYMAAVPYHETPFADIPVIVKNRGWSSADQETLNNNGVSFFGNNSAVNRVILGDVVTTYLTDENGVSDNTFKYLNAVDTASQIREYFFNNSKYQYAQTVLTTGDVTGVGRQANEATVRSFIIHLYKNLTGKPYGLCEAGRDAINFFKQNLNVGVVTDSGMIIGFDVSMIVPIVKQLRVLNGTLRISFSFSSQGA
jgi:phage tail sheath gpL-like